MAFLYLAVHWGGRDCLSPTGTDWDSAAELCLLLLSFVRERKSREKFEVCLNIYMQD